MLSIKEFLNFLKWKFDENFFFELSCFNVCLIVEGKK